MITVRDSGCEYSNATREGRTTASVPRATSGFARSGDCEVSVNCAVRVLSDDSRGLPRA